MYLIFVEFIIFTMFIVSTKGFQQLISPMKSRTTSWRQAHTTIIGAGAVGSFYGSRLVQGRGDDSFTFFSPRENSSHIKECREKGLTVESIAFNKQHIPHSYRTYFSSDVSDLKESDWVVIALKGTNDAFDALEQLLPRVLRKDGSSRVVAVMNGLVDQKVVEIVESASLPVASISGCAAYICANRKMAGKVTHTYLGDLKGGIVKTSSLDAEVEVRKLADLWEGSGVAFECNKILPLRWQKSCWNVPFNGMCTVLNCTTDRIAGDDTLRDECTRVMDEVFEAANADLAARGESVRLGDGDKAQMWEHTDTMGAYAPSTLLDFRAGSELELQYMFDEIVERGEGYGVDMTKTKRMVKQLHEK